MPLPRVIMSEFSHIFNFSYTHYFSYGVGGGQKLKMFTQLRFVIIGLYSA